jgi:diadenosine tetraphosphate (Ap4A) HIT family hydrolase
MGKRAGFVDPTYARTGKYGAVISEIAQKNVCPFCPETFHWHTNPILRRDGSWFITKSMQPYKDTEHHFLILGVKHKVNVTELTPTDWSHIRQLIAWAEDRFGLLGGGLTLRFGDTRFTGATVSHLHLHLIVPQLDDAGRAKPVYFPIG